MTQWCGLLSGSAADYFDNEPAEIPLSSKRGKKKSRHNDCLGPFIRYDDGYYYPDLFTEFDEMMEANVLIYPLAELRRKVRDGEIRGNEAAVRAILKTPLTHRQVIALVEARKRDLLDADTLFAKEFYIELIKAAEDRRMLLQNAQKDDQEVARLGPSTIIAFNDEYEKEELVYMVEVNHVRKRITVCFRGSVTRTDWATNFELYFKDVPNPMRSHPTQEQTVRVHNGFYEYLFEPNSRGVTGPHGEELSEYQEIMQEHILPVLRQYPGYKLYCTGHSLGGALATLFAFQTAAQPDSVIPKPVSLFTMGAPYVGDAEFRSAHQLLESLGKLRHLRVSNHKDLVTTVPKMSFRWNVLDRDAHVGSSFKHVGMNLRLYAGSTPFEISYPKVRTGYYTSILDEITRGWDQTLFANFSWNILDYMTWPFHTLREYNARATANKPSLDAIHLNDLYGRHDIVGNLVPQF